MTWNRTVYLELRSWKLLSLTDRAWSYYFIHLSILYKVSLMINHTEIDFGLKIKKNTHINIWKLKDLPIWIIGVLLLRMGDKLKNKRVLTFSK